MRARIRQPRDSNGRAAGVLWTCLFYGHSMGRVRIPWMVTRGCNTTTLDYMPRQENTHRASCNTGIALCSVVGCHCGQPCSFASAAAVQCLHFIVWAGRPPPAIAADVFVQLVDLPTTLVGTRALAQAGGPEVEQRIPQPGRSGDDKEHKPATLHRSISPTPERRFSRQKLKEQEPRGSLGLPSQQHNSKLMHRRARGSSHIAPQRF